MGTGYVIDFSNSSFQRFIEDVVRINIYEDPGYEEYSSKANKLRQILNQESDFTVGTLILALLDYYENYKLKITPLMSMIKTNCCNAFRCPTFIIKPTNMYPSTKTRYYFINDL